MTFPSLGALQVVSALFLSLDVLSCPTLCARQDVSAPRSLAVFGVLTCPLSSL
jgi:hypothetical protein